MNFKMLGVILITMVGVSVAQGQINGPMPQNNPIAGPRKISEFIKKDAVKYSGMFNVFVQDNHYFVEVPKKIMGRDILVFTSLVKGSAQLNRSSRDFLGYPGDAIANQVVRFEMDKPNKLFMKQPIFSTINPEKGADLYEAIKATSLMPIVEVLDIVATGEHSVLVDFSMLYNANNSFFGLEKVANEMGLGPYQMDKSYPTTISAFENNVIFRSVKSYGKSNGGGGGGMPPMPPSGGGQPAVETNPTMWEVASSWYLLPEEIMEPRYADTRVGYFTSRYVDYTKNPQSASSVEYARRWRIEPKKEDIEKYKRGELVEPAKPIVFYVDSNTPKYLQPYIIAGVKQWQSSFEKIGFKNAIQARMMPTKEEDPNFSPEDARYSIISYKASPIPNAYGPHIEDPRSGEIVNSHIGIFHNMLDLSKNWYFAQCAPLDERVRKFPLEDDLMGELLQFVVAHEVGHTLGLTHNFAGSWTFSVAELRDRNFVKDNSHGASIMDYMRYNYVAQPSDKLDPKDLIPKIGCYDDFAIAWGYRYFPDKKSAAAVEKYLGEWVTAQRKENPRVYFGNERDMSDPRNQSEDLADNNMEANELGIQNLKRIMENLFKWTKGDDESYTVARGMYGAVRGQYRSYIDHVMRNLTGRYNTVNARSEDIGGYAPIPKAKQKEAMEFLNRNCFVAPAWLYEDKIVKVSGIDKNEDLRSYYSNIFGAIFNASKTFVKHELLAGDTVYALDEMLSDVYSNVYNDFSDADKMSAQRRILQTQCTNSLLNYYNNSFSLNQITSERGSEVLIIYTDLLKKIAEKAKLKASTVKDTAVKKHLTGMYTAINYSLTGDKKIILN